jgi:Ca2+/Na+ antiporter
MIPQPETRRLTVPGDFPCPSSGVSWAVNVEGTSSAVVLGSCALLLLVGMSLTLAADQATTRPNLQTVGLVVMLIALTTLVIAYTMRDPADPT